MVLALLSFLSFFYYEHSFAVLGEFNQNDYFGPRWPESSRDKLGNEVSWDDTYEQSFFYSLIDQKLFKTQNYFLEDLIPNVMCTQRELEARSDAIRFSFRAVTLSLLSEAYFKKCEKPVSLFEECNPETSLMKDYIKSIKRSSTSKLWSQSNNCPQCNIDYSCLELGKKIKLICSEKDNLFGMSFNPIGYYLVKESNIHKDDIGINNYGCVKRYSLVNKYKEFKDKNLAQAVLLVSENLTSQYPFGRGITALNLKEYQDLGISVLEKETVAKKTVKTIVKQKNPVKEKFKVKVKTQPVIAIKKSTQKPVEKKVPWYSTFFQACESLERLGLSKVRVNMEKFYFDYIFSTEKISMLKNNLKSFSTIKTLKTMKDQDKLGSTQSPLPLIFLKFLIDTKNHQGLYNLIQVLGEEFVVLNDIDEQKVYKKVLIELKMDDKGSFDWYLNVLSIKD